MNSSGIVSPTEGEPFWILGKNFMKDYYTTFDLTGGEMKFAPRLGSNTPVMFKGGRPLDEAAPSLLVVWIILFVAVAALIAYSVMMWLGWSKNKGNTIDVFSGKTERPKGYPKSGKKKPAAEESKMDFESFKVSSERVLVIIP